MKTFLGKKTLKTSLLKEIIKHRKLDMIIQGTYGKQNGTWKGCAVACSLRSLNIVEGKSIDAEEYSEHQRYETELGIPRIIARLEDKIFEGLSVKDSKMWPEKFIKAIPAGIDLKLVMPKFFVWLMGDLKQVTKNKDVLSSLQLVSDTYKKVADGKIVTRKEWKDVSDKAWKIRYTTAAAAVFTAAYAAAAYAAAAADADDDAAADADDDAADAAAYATTYAAAYATTYAATAYATTYAARQKYYKRMANKLIELLEAA